MQHQRLASPLSFSCNQRKRRFARRAVAARSHFLRAMGSGALMSGTLNAAGDTAQYTTATTAAPPTLDINATLGILTQTNTGPLTINSDGTNFSTFDPPG